MRLPMSNALKTALFTCLHLILMRIPYPFWRTRIAAFSEPNIAQGLSDHPLDHNNETPINIFGLLGKLFSKKSYSVRALSFKERKENGFIFSATGHNIFLERPLSETADKFYNFSQSLSWLKKSELTLKIEFLTPTSYRVLCALNGRALVHETPMVIGDIKQKDFEVLYEDHDSYYLLMTKNLRLELYKSDFRIKVFNGEGKAITETSSRSKSEFPGTLDSYPLGIIRDRKSRSTFATESFLLRSGEAIYGLGEVYSNINHVGKTIYQWIEDCFGTNTARNYKSVPFFFSTQGYGVFVNEHKPCTFWVGSRDISKNMVAVENDLMDYYFFYGPSPKQILKQYTALTGQASLPPKWSFGSWMSRISYKSQQETLEVAARLRKEKYPMDVIHLDTNWFEHDWQCDWKFSSTRFPEPEKMCSELLGKGFRVSLWQSPHVVRGLKEYKQLKGSSIVAKNKGPFLFASILGGPALTLDFSSEAGVKWYKERLKALFDIGVSVIKTDFGEDTEPHQQFSQYSGREMHNLYPLLYQKAAHEATIESQGRGLIWARAAWAGSQRYPVHWAGDSSACIEDSVNVLRGGLSLGMSGFSFWSHDVGGFVQSPNDYMYIRSTQMSIFQSHMRFHGNPPKFREPWNFGEQAQVIVREFLNLRYRLIPYIYTEAKIACEAGLPFMSSLVMNYPDDPSTFNIGDQYMCGRNIMVAPIVNEESARKVYFPKGKWMDFWSKALIEGPCWKDVDSPIDQIPVYIKGGSIVPLGPVMQYVDEQTLDDLALYICPDEEMNIKSYTILDDHYSNEISVEIIDKDIKVKQLIEGDLEEIKKVSVYLPV